MPRLVARDPDLQRFGPQEMRRYWERHAEDRGEVDFTEDPEGLGNVCYVNAPPFWNEYHAALQQRVFAQLLSLVPPPSGGERALDVGCGTGRWCRVLDGRGYAVTGIDLQERLIDRNRGAMPQIEFVTSSIQDFERQATYDLVTTVTVVQHMPPPEQEAAAARIGQLVRPGGRVLTIENSRHQKQHVFSRSAEQWTQLFAAAGFEPIAAVPFDYGPATRLLELAAAVPKRLARSGDQVEVDAFTPGAPSRRVRPRAWLSWAARRAVVAIDSRVEPLLMSRSPRLEPTHVGLLFQKRP